MNRRGFLGAILALGVAPYVVSGGVGRGVLMPVRKLWVPNDARIKLFDASGRLLATIGYPEAKFDVAAYATVMNTGHIHHSNLEHPIFGSVPINLNFATHDIVTGSILNITPLQISV